MGGRDANLAKCSELRLVVLVRGVGSNTPLLQYSTTAGTPDEDDYDNHCEDELFPEQAAATLAPATHTAAPVLSRTEGRHPETTQCSVLAIPPVRESAVDRTTHQLALTSDHEYRHERGHEST
jgi:hypothetical protein